MRDKEWAIVRYYTMTLPRNREKKSWAIKRVERGTLFFHLSPKNFLTVFNDFRFHAMENKSNKDQKLSRNEKKMTITT